MVVRIVVGVGYEKSLNAVYGLLLIDVNDVPRYSNRM